MDIRIGWLANRMSIWILSNSLTSQLKIIKKKTNKVNQILVS